MVVEQMGAESRQQGALLAPQKVLGLMPPCLLPTWPRPTWLAQVPTAEKQLTRLEPPPWEDSRSP